MFSGAPIQKRLPLFQLRATTRKRIFALPMRRPVRAGMRALLFPFYYALVRADRVFDGFDGRERSMFTGLSITARK